MSIGSRALEDMPSWTTADYGRISPGAMEAEDFRDVFGGPPPSVLNRKSSCDTARFDCFYRDIFRRSEEVKADRRSRLPGFTIPASKLAEKKPPSRMWRSLSRSKPNSSSVLSSEETRSIPIQSRIKSEDVALDSFSSKHSPINGPCRWNSSTGIAVIESNQTSYTIDDHYPQNEQFPSPVDGDDAELKSQSSADTMLCHCSEDSKSRVQLNESYDLDEDEEDDFSSSYVIEINSGRREASNEADDIDEAIAWAKGTFQGCSSSSGEHNLRQQDSNSQFGRERSMIPLIEIPKTVSLYMDKGINQGIMDLDESVNSWSGGKETDIRLLLSTLHQVLWASSGWKAVESSNLMEESQVKKAYQRARLCIHPDKLQQRGATDVQKYTAERVFSVLQYAWDAFISQEIFFG